MKSLPIGLGIIVLCSSPLSILAQEIGYVDLTDNRFRERSRQTRTFSGNCGGSPHAAPSQTEVTAAVISLDAMRYRIGEEASFEIKILNSGKEKVVVPWTPHLGDLEPANARSSYKYRVGVILLVFRDPEGREFSISETLYGSPDVPGSLRELSPGEWFTVKGRKRVDLFDQNWGRHELKATGFVETKVSGFYRQDTATYSPKNGGSEIQWCIPLRCQRANQFDVTLQSR
ncbi:MAG TPA: hypothetical protein VKH18_15805 [Terriglobales bacterium]|nr:hypothetical protein [Terriglobales bacterium]